MAKRPNPRAVRATRTYTIEEAANVLGVTVGTVRGWVKAGLPIMATKRPFLILGDSLRGFIEARRDNARGKLSPDQLYCLRCKTGRRPLGLLVDVWPQSPKTARLFGLCEVCGGTCNRMISLAQIDQIRTIFDCDFKGGSKT
jgi:excisionase family DNA binding protein